MDQTSTNFAQNVMERTQTQEKRPVLSLIEQMEEMVSQAKGVPFSANCMVNREELLLLIGMLQNNLPNEVKQAKWLLDRQNQVIEQAQATANSIVAQAETRVAMMINEHEITELAQKTGQGIVDDACREADAILNNARDYIHSQLEQVEENLVRILHSIQKDKNQMHQDEAQV